MIISTVPAGATDQLATQSPAGAGQLLFDVLYEPVADAVCGWLRWRPGPR